MCVVLSEDAAGLNESLAVALSSPLPLLLVTLRDDNPMPPPNVVVSFRLGSAMVRLVWRSSKFTGGRSWKGSEVKL